MADAGAPNPFAPSAAVTADGVPPARWPARLLAILSALFSVGFLGGAGHLILGNRGRALRWIAIWLASFGVLMTSAVMGWGVSFVITLSAVILLWIAALIDVSFARASAPVRPLIGLGLAVGIVAAGLLVGRAMRATVTHAYQTPADGMAPTIVAGDRFMAAVGGRAQRGDVIVFAFPRDRNVDYVKRVVGTGGDTVEVKDNVVLVNGQALPRRSVEGPCLPDVPELAPCSIVEESSGDRRYLVVESNDSARSSMAPRTVPAGHVFVLGDNRHNSNDSRIWGFVPLGDVRGRASVIYWSSHADGSVRWDRIGRSVD